MTHPAGRVVGTERRPNTTHEFHFWTGLEAQIGIGSIVKVVADAQTVYGVVVEGFSYTDLLSPLHDYIGADADPGAGTHAPSLRPEIRLYSAAVLRREPEEPVQPVPMGAVYLADDSDVVVGLRMDSYVGVEDETGIPLGVYASGGLEARVYLDADFLLGPEAAHLNITGVSGLATKTSLVEFLLASVFEHLPESKGSVAAVCFNVKGPDLLFLDQPGELDENDRHMYGLLEVPPEPFKNVRFFAPYRPDGWNLNTLRTHADLIGSVRPLRWGLKEVMQFSEVLLTRDDLDAKADALIDFIRDRVLDQRFGPEVGQPVMRNHLVRTFRDLEDWFDDVLACCEASGSDRWMTHHTATIRKVRNRLNGIVSRAHGLVVNDDAVSDLPWGEFEDRAVYVIDVANVEPEAQDLVFARVVSRLREGLESGTLGVKHVIVFADELNKYAPSDGPDTYVRKMLLDISERGRYLGLVLFGAQQFRSQVHRRVVGNCGSAVYGRMDMDELATPGYSVLSPASKTKLASLPKGDLMVRHPHFTQPIFIRFPKPAVMRGRDGIERFPPRQELPFEDAVAQGLRRIDSHVRVNELKDLIAGRERSEVLQAFHHTERASPDDALAFFRSRLRKSVSSETVGPPQRAVSVPDDPYAGD
ncbi:MAG: ATP-binding protein [Gemmatimonadetes bacterium]|nr:ATP-binding protein [Gemmatimonadota bacterium]NIO32109.1 ATP-binding protein [Gemmatimonadota bacterium]